MQIFVKQKNKDNEIIKICTQKRNLLHGHLKANV